jgi:hypothetical protein
MTNFLVISNSVTTLSSNSSGWVRASEITIQPGPLFLPIIAISCALAFLFVWLAFRKRTSD